MNDMSNQGLPTCIHIGTQKAGSTFLYNLLEGHPDVSLSSQTEVHYYSKYFDQGEAWYLGLYQKPGVKVDTSPKYFMNGAIAAPRIKEAVGKEAKLLLIIRNPIDLLNSHYQMHVISGHFTKHPDVYPVVPSSVVDCAKRYPDYLKQANYHTQLQEWLQQFDASQIKVVIFEEFVKDTERLMNEILEFWGLAPMPLTARQTSKNKMLKNRFLFNLRSRVVRITWLKEWLKKSAWFAYVYEHHLTQASKKTITAAERQTLADILRSEVDGLESYLGHDISAWKDFH